MTEKNDGTQQNYLKEYNHIVNSKTINGATGALSYRTNDILKAIQLLRQMSLDIPLEPIETDIDPSTMQVGDTITTKNPGKPLPIRRSDGAILYQVYTENEATKSIEQIGTNTIINMSGNDFFNLISNWPSFTDGPIIGIVVNPYTNPFFIPKEIFFYSSETKQHILAKGTPFLLEKVTSDAEPLIKAVTKSLKVNPKVLSAYLAIMTSNNEKSYLLYIDTEEQEIEQYLIELNRSIQKAKPTLPIDYACNHKEMKTALENAKIEPFFKKAETAAFNSNDGNPGGTRSFYEYTFENRRRQIGVFFLQSASNGRANKKKRRDGVF